MTDPHIHVEQSLNADIATRDLTASLFGRVGDLPSVVTSGCGLQVPRAMTSHLPERVTCLACREHAHRQHLRYAEQVEQLIGMPGLEITTAQLRQSAEQYRDLAAQFST